MISNLQIGKSGLTSGIMETIKSGFKKHKILKLKILKSSEFHNGEKIKVLAEQIKNQMPKISKIAVIGFTIILKK